MEPDLPRPDDYVAGAEHALKVWPDYFDAIADGSKTFEVRWDDRTFLPDDRLLLREWSPEDGYTGRWCRRTVTYVLNLGAFFQAIGHPPAVSGWVVMGLADVEAATKRAGERQRLVDAILDIDAHATAYGEDEDGYVNGGYLISIGCLHRALGVVGHSAAKCRHCGPEAHGCADKEALVDTAALALEYARKVEAGTADHNDISTLVCHLVVLTEDLPEALNTPQSVFVTPPTNGSRPVTGTGNRACEVEPGCRERMADLLPDGRAACQDHLPTNGSSGASDPSS